MWNIRRGKKLIIFSQFEMESLRYSYLHARYEYSRHRWLTCINVYTKNFAINQVWRNQIRKFIKNSFQFILVSTEILISMTQKKSNKFAQNVRKSFISFNLDRFFLCVLPIPSSFLNDSNDCWNNGVEWRNNKILQVRKCLAGWWEG